MDEQIKSIRQQFLDEASSSPVLMSDLANMEKYIAESYDGRSLIELLQNADDAQSTKFHIEKIGDGAFLVANNGRVFDEADLVALCRSGASTKKRKSTTIGYRGIGFKSVVNYSERVHLISGDVRVTFSRELTREVLNAEYEVPLVRIPHGFTATKYDQAIKQALKKGYTTIFIFEANNLTIEKEIADFDKTCMLFLKNVNEVSFDYDGLVLYNTSRQKMGSEQALVCFADNDGAEKWLVYSKDQINAFACYYESDKISETPSGKNLIHSFMPTRDKFLIPCKINGDFSTDPSRTHVIVDAETDVSMAKVAALFVEQIGNILQLQGDHQGLVQLVAKARPSAINNILLKRTANDVFFDYFKEKLTSFLQDELWGKRIYIQPNWLTDEDLSYIQSDDEYIVSYGLIEKIAGLKELLKTIGISEIPSERILEASAVNEFSLSTRLELLSKLIHDYRFNLPVAAKQKIERALLIQGKNGVVRIADITNSDDILLEFVSELNSNMGGKGDAVNFLAKFGIINVERPSVSDMTKPKKSDPQKLSKTNPTKRWRSVEMNALSVLEELDDVKSVLDVSRRNVGYDIEATMKDGTKQFFEVKSVNKLGDEFSMTNNEYLTALQFPGQYNLLIACQGDQELEYCIVKDPIHTLDLEKRIKSYEWVCNAYAGDRVVCQLGF